MHNAASMTREIVTMSGILREGVPEKAEQARSLMVCTQRSISVTCSFLSDQLSRILYSSKPAQRGSHLLSILGTERVNPWSAYSVLIRIKSTSMVLDLWLSML